MTEQACPVCGASDCFDLVRREQVPVHQNLVYSTEREALGIARGTLAMRFCPACGFCWNSEFSDALMTYDTHYDGNQAYSDGFSAYLEDVALTLVNQEDLRERKILEIGCGQGGFLASVTGPRTGAVGQGFDPAYLGPMSRFDGALTFRRAPYEPTEAEPADILICRHLIEHLPDPVNFLASLRPALNPSGLGRAYFETPDLEWILRHQIPWDLFYEHCSLFSAGALATALASGGFSPGRVRRVFGGQYLWAESSLRHPEARATAPADLAELAQCFAVAARSLVDDLQQWIADCAQRGPLVVWGAGAKGATLCHLVDRQRHCIDAVVDVNPAKQGGWVPGTAHRIIAPAALDPSTATVLAMNPNYVEEIRDEATLRAASASVVDITSVVATLRASR